MREAPARPTGGRLRNDCRVLHGEGPAEARFGFGFGDVAVGKFRPPDARGSALVEVLISLSILAIGIIGVLSGSRAVRMQAELASRRAVEALAAQQVLDHRHVWAPDDSVSVDTVSVGVHVVEVRTEVSEWRPGLVRVMVSADAGAGAAPWRLVTARRTGI